MTSVTWGRTCLAFSGQGTQVLKDFPAPNTKSTSVSPLGNTDVSHSDGHENSKTCT